MVLQPCQGCKRAALKAGIHQVSGGADEIAVADQAIRLNGCRASLAIAQVQLEGEPGTGAHFPSSRPGFMMI